jgi:hypothetical protein
MTAGRSAMITGLHALDQLCSVITQVSVQGPGSREVWSRIALSTRRLSKDSTGGDEGCECEEGERLE